MDKGACGQADRAIAYRKPRPRFEIVRGNGRRYEIIERRAANGDTLVISRDVQDEFEQRRALERNEQRFRHFAEGASDWLWETDAQLRFTYFSDAFFEISRISPSRVLGKRRDEVWAHSDGDADWQAHLEQMRRHEIIKDYIFCATDDNGLVRHFRINGQPYWTEDGEFAGYRGTSRELSAEMHAIEREQQLVDALGTISQGVALFDAAGQLEVWSANWRAFSLVDDEIYCVRGVDLQTLLQAIAEKLSAQTRFSVSHWLQRLTRPSVASDVEPVQYRLPNGRWIEFRTFVLESEKTVQVLSDVSALKRRELALEESETQI